MLELLDRLCVDSTFLRFIANQLTPLEERYCPDLGRPAIHPEVMVRALLIRSLYNIASFRRLRSAISENIAFMSMALGRA